MQSPLLLVGAGPMAIEYAKVLAALDMPFITIGNGSQSAMQFEKAIGLPVIQGGDEEWLAKNNEIPSDAIVAVGEKRLGKVAINLIKHGIKNILIEKPGGLDPLEIQQVATMAKENNANAFVGYNRRFYASVAKAKEIINADGGVLSFNFEFTEWSHVIADLKKEEGVKEQWFLANSSHVVDLAFYLGGKPQHISSYTAGSLNWHPHAAIYAGAGKTEEGALFSYQANWQAPGRWVLEVMTKYHRLIFKPMEKLQVQKQGSVAIEEIQIEDEFDKQFKPGLYKQVEAFFNKSSELPSIFQQLEMLKYYQQINPL